MRILLAGMSNMLTSIISAALEQSPDVIIAGSCSEHDDLALQIRVTQADAVLMQVAEPGNAVRFRALLLSFPTLKVVAITSDGKRGFLHELRPRSTRIVELSAASLQAALRPGPLQRTH
jgi:DNA-binding NarL/FixJ family response regulator